MWAGISMVSKRYAISNNKYVDNYYSSKRSNDITYLNANNLHGWAMSQPLPASKFQ